MTDIERDMTQQNTVNLIPYEFSEYLAKIMKKYVFLPRLLEPLKEEDEIHKTRRDNHHNMQ